MSCFQVENSTFCSAWNNKSIKVGTKLQNSDLIINDTESLDASILQIFDKHYSLINGNCQKDVQMRNYAAWLCDSAIEGSEGCSNTRICQNTCQQFSYDYSKLTETCSGDLKTYQTQISKDIQGYCINLNSTDCVIGDANLIGNCGYHNKNDICSKCPTKIDAFCNTDGLSSNSFKTVSTTMLVLGLIVAIGILTYCISIRIRRGRKLKSILAKGDAEMNYEDYIYDPITNKLIAPSNSTIDTSKLTGIGNNSSVVPVNTYTAITAPVTTARNTLPLTTISRYSDFIKQSDSINSDKTDSRGRNENSPKLTTFDSESEKDLGTV
eukprot:NODE_116_length_19003_cov_0.233707.p5 type:complete len:324 gc:universal NODE_116_length_19003_cov_0.233707:8462-9433(+)